jgi:hypothetical protein
MYIKLPQNITNGRKINIVLCKTLKKLTKIWILGLKIFHLATLPSDILETSVFVDFITFSGSEVACSQVFYPGWKFRPRV